MSGTREKFDTVPDPSAPPPPKGKAKGRATWAALLLAVVGGLSQVPWNDVLAFLTSVLGGK